MQPTAEPQSNSKPATTPQAVAASATAPKAEEAPPEPEPEPIDGLPKLADAQRSTLLSGPEDPPFTVDTHYIQSNETRHDLYFPYIEGIGGALIGVGSDQSFTLAATAQSELLFMMDIDTRVVELQRMYSVLIPAADSAEALVNVFHANNEAATNAVLAEAFADLPEKKLRRFLRGFRIGRETVYRHLKRVHGRTIDGEPTSWLSDPDKFAHIQDLYRKGRVRVMVGNLAGSQSLRTVSKACEELDTPVRVLYMSNAEEYFKYTPDFRANIEALPIDDGKSVVLRTIYSKKWPHADLWAYQVQPIVDFRTRLADKRIRSRSPMLRLAKNAKELTRVAEPKGLSLVAMSPKP